jgi:hypothetical protein
MTLQKSRPEPFKGPVRLDGESYDQILELWGFMSTFSGLLKVLTLPSISVFTDAIRVVEPNYRKVLLNSRSATRSFEVVSGER